MALGGAGTEVACWAQARRKFLEAQDSDVMRAMVMLAYVRLLYDAERGARDLKLGSAGRLALRQARSVPILEDIAHRLNELLPHRWKAAREACRADLGVAGSPDAAACQA